MPRISSFLQSLNSSRGSHQVGRSWSVLATSSSSLRLPLFCACWSNSCCGSLKRLQHPFWYVANSQVFKPRVQHLTPSPCGFPSHPRLFQGYWQTEGNSQWVYLKLYSKRLVFLNIHSIESMSHEFSFIHLQIFLSTLKGNTKIWLCTGGEKACFSSLSFQFGNIVFSDFVKVVAILLL